MKRISSVLFVAIALSLSGCGRDPVRANQSAGLLVSAVRVESGIRITNNTDRGIAYVVSNPQWLGLLGMCEDPGPSCVTLAPGASVVVPFDEIHGYSTTATEASVFWWHVVPDGADGYRKEDLTTVFVSL